MTALIIGFHRAFLAEMQKMRGALATWMCLIAPAVVVTMLVLQIGVGKVTEPLRGPELAWDHFISAVLALWAFLMLPLFVTLQAALLASLEHSGQMWKHLRVLPIPPAAHYLAKTAMLATLVSSASACLAVLAIIGGYVLGVIQPEFGIAGPPPVARLLRLAAAIAGCAALMSAIQLWIALRWSSFTATVAFGMSATVAGFLIGQSQQYGRWYPWSLSLQPMASTGENTGAALLLALGGGAVVTVLGLVNWARREVA